MIHWNLLTSVQADRKILRISIDLSWWSAVTLAVSRIPRCVDWVPLSWAVTHIHSVGCTHQQHMQCYVRCWPRPVSHGSTPTSQKTRLEYYEFRPQSNRAVLKEYYVRLLTPNQTAALFLINDHTTAQVAARPVVVCYCASSIRHHKVLDSANWHLLGSQLGNSCIVIQWGRLPFNYCWGDPPLQVVVKFHYLLRQGPLKCCGIQWL